MQIPIISNNNLGLPPRKVMNELNLCIVRPDYGDSPRVSKKKAAAALKESN